jgi:hypothetical protein
MNKFWILAISLAALAVSVAVAQDAKKAAGKPAADKPAAQSEIKLPPGWTAADMQACIAAGTPGANHERLTKDAGTWLGKNTMWMGPGTEAVKSDSTTTITPMLDGRFVKLEMAGEMPGMGPYLGFAISGYDNVSKKFVSTWIDNHGTGLATGEGELSKDGKTLTWNYTFNCPITNKPAVLRQIETVTGPATKTLEMFGADPKTGKEYKMMVVELTKKK